MTISSKLVDGKRVVSVLIGQIDSRVSPNDELVRLIIGN